MKTLLPILIFSLFFAYLTEITTCGKFGKVKQSSANRFFFFCLLVSLAVPAGLRTYYNDTWNYINNFLNSPPLSELFLSGQLKLLQNPAFLVFSSLLRSITDNYHIFLMLSAFFVQYSYISFIRRYCASLSLGIAIYFLFGCYVFSLAALKQTIALAILLLAIPKLLDQKYLLYYLLVFIAFLFHTYAIAFAILPLFTVQPWKIHTYILLFAIMFVMVNFQSVIGTFLDVANESGKSVAEYEVFDNNQVNTMRVLVYSVVPILSFVLKDYLFRGNYSKDYHFLIHMAIFSFSIMLLGTINGANMFARMAQYYEFGIICSLPWILSKAFEPRSARLITIAAIGCFFVYFFYANQVALDFDSAYQSITFVQFLQTLF